MPIYEYGCKNCDHEFQETSSVDDRYVPCWDSCIECGEETISILLGTPAIKFEGDGWTPKYHK